MQATDKGGRLSWSDVQALKPLVNYHVAQVQPACYILALDLARVEEELLHQVPLIMRADKSPALDPHIFDVIEVRSYKQVMIRG